MSEFTVHLSLRPYLANYVKSVFGDPVVLPRMVEEFRLLKELLRKLPLDKKPDMGKGSNLTIVIPKYEEKDPETYNYLSENGKRILSGSFEEWFWKNFYKELSGLDRMDLPIKDCVLEFMDKHDLPPDSFDMLIKRYYRWRVRMRQNYNIKV